MKPSAWRLALPWSGLLVVGLGAAALRFGLIESSTIGQFCSSHDLWWCSVRNLLVLGFLHNVYGGLALIGTLLTLLSRRSALAWLAAALGVFAMQLYCVEAGALATLIGSLRLLRLQADACGAPVEQHRQREQQVQAQP